MGNLFLTCVKSLVALADDAVDVAHHHISEAHADQQLADGDSGCARAVDDDLDLAHLLAGDLDGVDQGRGNHDGGAVLVVVEYGNIADLL